MNFWDTVKGHHLADVLIQELPNLSDSLGKIQGSFQTFQYVRRVKSCATGDCIEKEIMTGAHLVGIYPCSEPKSDQDESIIVFETEK